jgi:hypothetical protein
MLKKVFFPGGIIMIVLSCMSPEKIFNNPDAEKLYFGNFGGFSNQSMDYVLIDHSRIFKIEQNDFSMVTRLDKHQVGELNELLQSVDIERMELNEPGNMTYYIRLVKPGLEKEIKWSDQTQYPQVNQLYHALLANVKQ